MYCDQSGYFLNKPRINLEPHVEINKIHTVFCIYSTWCSNFHYLLLHLSLTKSGAATYTNCSWWRRRTKFCDFCGSPYTTFEIETMWSFRTIFPVRQSTRRCISKGDSLHPYRCDSLKYCRICVTDNLTIPIHLPSNCQSDFALPRLSSIKLCVRICFSWPLQQHYAVNSSNPVVRDINNFRSR